MKRLDYSRRARNTRAHTNNAAEAVMFLAQVARERQRLEQERRSLERRLRKIDSRLTQIAGAETRLVPVIQLAMQRPGGLAGARPITVPAAPADPLSEVTLQY
jgi:hypothetical protein